MLILVSGGTQTIENLRKHPFYSRIAAQHIGGLITPRTKNSIEWYLSRGMQWACDNDCFQKLDRKAYIKMLKGHAGLPGCLWVVAPDVVAEAEATLIRFKMWEPVLRYFDYPVAFVAQNGIENIVIPWNDFECLFIGGDDNFKLGKQVVQLIKEAHQQGKLVHMGRVNSPKRIAYALAAEVDSIDGTGFSRWGDAHLPGAIGYAATHETKQLWLNFKEVS